jgi:phage baseplate assembly protein W
MEKVVSKILKQYRDIDLDMTIHPLTDDLVQLKNIDAINKSLRNILKTGTGQRVFDPDFGSTINTSLFEPMDMMTAHTLQTQIENAIMLHEKRVRVTQVIVLPDHDSNAYDVFVHYTPKNSNRNETLELFLKRLR